MREPHLMQLAHGSCCATSSTCISLSSSIVYDNLLPLSYDNLQLESRLTGLHIACFSLTGILNADGSLSSGLRHSIAGRQAGQAC